MFKTAAIFFCALLLFSGCSTTPREAGDSMPLDWQSPDSISPITIPTNKWTAIPITNPPAIKISPTNVVHTNPAAHRPAPILTWTSLNRWASEKKLAAPRRIAVSPVTTFAVVSENNVIVLTIGSHDATFNGIQIHLGFTPEIIDDQVFVHGLDLQKNIEPLLLEPPLQFSGTNRIIVLDPGHGGINGGTVSVLDKRPEKEFTLDWARRLKPLLETNGWTVFLTRTNDLDIALSNRVAIAESHHADLFISLHFNSAAPDKKQNGLETYCLTPMGMPSTLTRGFPDLTYENLPNNLFDPQNLQLAVLVHKKLLHTADEEDRGVRRARFIGVLRGQKRPAILLEGGYLSNPHEAERIGSPEFRQKLAEAVAAALTVKTN